MEYLREFFLDLSLKWGLCYTEDIKQFTWNLIEFMYPVQHVDLADCQNQSPS